MKCVLIAAMTSAIAIASALAAECKAVSADGKPLSGAVKTSHMKKCCTGNAISKEGKPLYRGAKASFVKKCMGTRDAGG